MNSSDVPLIHGRYDLGFNKHVTTACIQCRKKRRKCNGSTPCFACSKAEIECIYDHTDLRKRQRRKSAANHSPHQLKTSPTALSTATDSKGSLLLNEKHDSDFDHDATGVDRDYSGQITHDKDPSQPHRSAKEGSVNLSSSTQAPCSVRTTSQSFLVKQTEAMPERTTIHASGHDTKAWRLVSKSRGHSDTNAELAVRSMKLMQSKFDAKAYLGRSQVRDHKAISKDRDSYDVRTGPFAEHVASELPHASKRRQTHRSLRPARQRQYAAPGYTRTFGNLPFSSSIQANGYPTHVQARQCLNFRAPEHLIAPLTYADESPLGRTFTDFQRLGKGLIASGTPASQISEHGLIDVTLFFRPRSPDDPINASSWASEMLRSFRGTFSDALLLACAVCVGSLMRWVLMPTPDNYANLPPIMRPTSLQRSIPHPPWVDLMVFPTFRDSLVNELRDWAEPCVKAKWDLSWPGSLEEALVHDSKTERIFVSSAFATYVTDPKNWIMQRSILDAFPEIEGSEINIAEE